MQATNAIHSSSAVKRLLSDLNDAQRSAVVHAEGPILILAGAGSGKTRVLTYKIAYLIHTSKARPSQIIAMTFTNKAAQEMRNRIQQLIPKSLEGLWIGTFHSLFARILRRECDRLGFDHNFVIYDTNDQKSLIKLIMADQGLSQQQFSPKSIQARISSIKSSMKKPEQFARSVKDYFDDVVAKIYPEYQRRLKQNNAMDFDDLLIKPIELFENNPSVLESFQERFNYILVDEYQDTNRAQYVILKQLAGRKKNICVVGDDDQSIYRWRGADISNILDFERDYPNCAVFRLEQNYRSTKNILAAAHSVVVNNIKRHEKELWTEKGDGELVTVFKVYDEVDEAQRIVKEIEAEFGKGRRSFSDFAILYRTNAQSRALEDGLRSSGISYIIVGGVRFYERKEVKDVLAYLRTICNPADSVSLRRIINYPPRSIGEATLAKLEQFALDKRISLFEAMGKADQIQQLLPRATARVLEVYHLLDKYRSLLTELSPAELSASMVEEIGIIRYLQEEGTIEANNRVENVRELLLAIAQFSNNREGNLTLEEFLQEVSLISDIDSWDNRSNAVTLMTLHSAKGLEFPVVFITGLEEGLFPISTAIGDPEELGEERRLFYVGSTRAKDRLVLSWAQGRRRYGDTMERIASRFISEIDASYITVEETFPNQTARQYHSRRKLIMPNYEDESQEYFDIRKGTRVNHSKFGNGTVLSVDFSGMSTKATVQFDQVGRKKLDLEYAKLEII